MLAIEHVSMSPYLISSDLIPPSFYLSIYLSLSPSLRWSALTAYDILTEYKTEYLRVVEAFRDGLPLEECIAAIEGEGEVKLFSNQ